MRFPERGWGNSWIVLFRLCRLSPAAAAAAEARAGCVFFSFSPGCQPVYILPRSNTDLESGHLSIYAVLAAHDLNTLQICALDYFLTVALRTTRGDSPLSPADNFISTSAAAAFAEALKENTALLTLHVTGKGQEKSASSPPCFIFVREYKSGEARWPSCSGGPPPPFHLTSLVRLTTPRGRGRDAGRMGY